MNYNPTQKMIEARANGIQTARDTAKQLISAARVAHDSIVTFSHINEQGESVLPRANKEMRELRDALIGAFNSLVWVISPDYDFRNYMDYIKWLHKFAGGKFHNDEEWIKNWSHLDAEIIRLKDEIF